MLGAALPLFVAWTTAGAQIIPAVAIASLLSLLLLGGFAARIGGASVVLGAARVTAWGLGAMLLTAGVGRLFGVVA